ncbi:MAG: cytochrome c3 family protein [Planctomycetota bacterium]
MGVPVLILNFRLKSIKLVIFIILSASILTQTAVKKEKNVCISCHLETGEKALIQPVEDFTKKENDKFLDVHAYAGLSCHNCHGGDPTNEDRAKDESAGYIGKPKPKDIPALCSKCHSDIEYIKQFNPRLPTDQFYSYQTSIHGKRLKEGDRKVASCVSCHNAHGIRFIKDPASPVYPKNIPNTCSRCHSDEEYMKGYNIPTNQFKNYTQSKHGQMLLEQGDITAPNCATCHGSHGAVPPGVSAVYQICGQCHTQQEEYFSKSSHAKAFQEAKKPGCVTCHGMHEIPTPTAEMMSNKPGSICMLCHKEGDHCYMAVDKMKNTFNDVNIKLTQANEILEKATKLGMDVEKAKFSLNEVKDFVTKARIKVHQFKEEVVLEELKKAVEIIDSAIKRGQKALQEWQYRRIGLGISLILILLTIISLILKIRTLKE